MPITIVCQSCGGKLRVADAAAGKNVKCPKCDKTIAIPAASAVASMPTALVPAASVSSTKEPVNNAAQLDDTHSPIDDTLSYTNPRRASWTVPLVVGAVVFVLLLGCGGVLVVVIGIGGMGILTRSADTPPMQQAAAEKNKPLQDNELDEDMPPLVQAAMKQAANKGKKPDIDVLTVDNLFKTYRISQAIADKRYLNQWISVSGTVDEANRTLVVLRPSSNRWGRIRCIPHANWNAERVLPGEVISIIGLLKSSEDAGMEKSGPNSTWIQCYELAMERCFEPKKGP